MIIGWIEIRAYQNYGRALCNMMRWCFLKIPFFTVFLKKKYIIGFYVRNTFYVIRKSKKIATAQCSSDQESGSTDYT